MKVVPHAFYLNPTIEKILIDGDSCVIHKKVTTSDVQNKRYLSSHALTLVLQGGLQIEKQTGELTRVRKNQMVLLPKGLYAITDIIPDDQCFEAIVFFFDQEITDEFLSSFEKSNSTHSTCTFLIDYNENLRLYTDTLLALYKGKNAHQFTKPKLLELLHLISISEKGDAFVQHLIALKNRERLHIKKFMLQNFEKPLDIVDYAYLTGRSLSTFQRDFKSTFHTSPKKWLIEKRMQEASQLLRTTSDSVTNIAYQVGYENVSHFIKAFHKLFGSSPKQYQIQNRKNTLI
nr:AraC family transcriptional regulator [uncultured Dokdonia sp.]